MRNTESIIGAMANMRLYSSGSVPVPSSLVAALGQCMAAMIAAELFNRQEENELTTIFGCVTTGDLWRFLKLQSAKEQRTIFIDTNFIDTKQYFATQVNELLGILRSMVQ